MTAWEQSPRLVSNLISHWPREVFLHLYQNNSTLKYRLGRNGNENSSSTTFLHLITVERSSFQNWRRALEDVADHGTQNRSRLKLLEGVDIVCISECLACVYMYMKTSRHSAIHSLIRRSFIPYLWSNSVNRIGSTRDGFLPKRQSGTPLAVNRVLAIRPAAPLSERITLRDHDA